MNQSYSISDKAFNKRLSARENLRALRTAGFTHIHFSFKWQSQEWVSPADLEQWQHDLAATGMQVLDVHGTHPPDAHFWSEGADARGRALNQMVHRLRLCRALGGDAVVYHAPEFGEPTAALVARYVDMLARLEPTARDLGISVALENHYIGELNRRALSACFERFSPDYLGFTLDPGHAALAGDLNWLCQNCGDRLRILHLNDNDGLEDRHWLPRDPRGVIDWRPIVAVIAGSTYGKALQLEARWDSSRHGTHGEFLAEGIRQLKKLHEEIQSAVL